MPDALNPNFIIDEQLFAQPVYALPRSEKQALLCSQLNALTDHHGAHCALYRQILAAAGVALPIQASRLEDFPFLHARLFKEFHLASIPDSEVVKELTSSGTSGQRVSRIYLDRITAQRQTRALVYIMQHFLGTARMPMLIIDHANVIKGQASFSARGAGILGLSNFGRDHTYALNDDMTVALPIVREFLTKYAGQAIFVFGFTFMVWQYFIQALRNQNQQLDLSNAILVHSGGWKKLQEQAVDNQTFRQVIGETIGTRRIHNFYGMIEQVGSIFVECEHLHFHTPIFADIIVRDPASWSVQTIGTPGVIQLLSALPWSYPGHSVLSEDIGTLIGEDDCACGRKGKYFTVMGRIPRAERRGCSDTVTDNSA